MRVLICGIERETAEMIRDYVDWTGLDLTFTGITDPNPINPNAVLLENPEIVITGIGVPVFDGLKLVEAARNADLKTRFIIVSHFQSFDYVQTALRYDVSDYLLLPLDERELNLSLMRVKQAVFTAGQSFGFIRYELDQTRRQLRQELLRAVVACCNMKNFYTVEEDFFREIKDNEYAFWTMKFDSNLPLEERLPIMDAAMKQTHFKVDKYLEPKNTHYTTVRYINNIQILLCSPDLSGKPELLEQLSTDLFSILSEVIGAYPGFHGTLAMGPCMRGAGTLEEAVVTEMCATRSRALVGADRIIPPSKTYLIEDTYSFTEEEKASFQNLVDCCDVEGLLSMVQMVFQNSSVLKERPFMIIRIARDMLDRFIHLAKLAKPTVNIEQINKLFNVHVDYMWSVDYILSTLRMCFNVYFDDVAEGSSTATNQYIQSIRQYVAGHYREKCSLDAVANEVHLNPSYLSWLFKEEMGITFSQFVQSCRMEYVKKQLSDTDYTVQVIAEQAGYSDLKHFRKLFKNTTGMTPNDYRNLYR